MSTVKENLIKAKALIDTPEKWTKGEYHKDNCLCALGAVADALGVDPVSARLTLSPEVSAIQMQVPEPFFSIWRYNDDDGTSHDDMMALFDRAIASTE